MTTNDNAIVFSSSHNQPSCSSKNGPFQPPRNSTAVSAANTTMPAYSASRNSANRRPVYSVNGPNTSSLSATGMSNGGRRNSASAPTKKTTPPMPLYGSPPPPQARPQPPRD